MRILTALALATATLVASTALLAPAAAVPVLEDRSAVQSAATRLLSFQKADGSWPSVVYPAVDACGCEDVAGVTALALLRAYETTTSGAYLASAGKTFDYLANLHATTTGPLSAPSVLFMAQYALVSGEPERLDVAIAAYARALAAAGGFDGLVDSTFALRQSEGVGNLAFWDVSLWAQAASAAGFRSDASELAARLNVREGTDLDRNAPHYALALAGVVEANAKSYFDNLQRAQAAAGRLAAAQLADGGFGDLKTTSAAALAFYAVGDVENGRQASEWVFGKFDKRNYWFREGGIERAPLTSQAIQALAAAAAPVPSGPASNAATTAVAAWAAQPSPDDVVVPGVPEECAGYPYTDVTPNGMGPAVGGACGPEGSIVYAWVCLGYGSTYDRTGTTLGFPLPGAKTLSPTQDAAIAQAAAEDAAAGGFDPAKLYAAYTVQDQNSGAACGQFVP